jgi:hypothetical protein
MAPYYQEKRPLDLLFELYVVDVLDELPEDSQYAVSTFVQKNPAFFTAYEGDWRRTVEGTLALSETIEVAIWDLWIKNRARAEKDGWTYHPWHFASNFLENYTAEGSQVDVWTDETLAQAIQRMQQEKRMRK